MVVGVDWDPSSAAAVDWGADYAASTSRPLLLLHATLWPTIKAPYGLAPPAQDLEEPQGSGTELLAQTLEHVLAERPDLDVDTQARAVSPIAVLLDRIAQRSHRRGRPPRSRASAASVRRRGGDACRHSCPCSVAVIRAQQPQPDSAPTILVGYDGSASSAAALEFGFAEAARPSWQGRASSRHAPDPPPRRLLVIHAVRSHDPGALEWAETWLAESVRELGAAFPEVTVETRAVPGHPMDTLDEAASSGRLGSVGDRGREGFAGLKLGSVAQGLLAPHRPLHRDRQAGPGVRYR